MFDAETTTRMGALCKQAVCVYGPHGQTDMAIEECAELIAALQQARRGRVTPDQVASEVADVLITCRQLMEIVGRGRVEAAVLEKLNRLESRLDSRAKGAKG